jgi:hypothetical protein
VRHNVFTNPHAKPRRGLYRSRADRDSGARTASLFFQGSPFPIYKHSKRLVPRPSCRSAAGARVKPHFQPSVEAAMTARQINQSLVGGASSISTTTIIILLLILIVLILALK